MVKIARQKNLTCQFFLIRMSLAEFGKSLPPKKKYVISPANVIPSDRCDHSTLQRATVHQTTTFYVIYVKNRLVQSMGKNCRQICAKCQSTC